MATLPIAELQLETEPQSAAESLLEIDIKDIEQHELIGSGTYGDVYRASMKSKDKKSKVTIAEKVLRPTKPEKRKEQEREVHVLSKLKHRYIVSFIGAVMSTASIIIITEFASNGSLHDYLKVHRLPSDLLYAWALQGALAIQYLQKKDLAHRDIKSSNFLVTAENILKLCDFGLARDLETTISTAMKGTIQYLAPEVFKDLKLSKSSDIYSYAIVLWEMLTSETPYKGMQGFQIIYQVGTSEKRPEISHIRPCLLLDLIKRCWSTDRHKRPDIDEVIRNIIHAGEQDRVFQWTLCHVIDLKTPPGPLAILADGKIAVSTSGRIDIYPATDDLKVQDVSNGNSCVYSIPTAYVECEDMALGYQNYLFASSSGELLIISTTEGTVKKFTPFKRRRSSMSPFKPYWHEVEPKIRRGRTSSCIGANPFLNYYFHYNCYSDMVLKVKEVSCPILDDERIHHSFAPNFIDVGIYGKILLGNFHNIIVDDENPVQNNIFHPSKTWLFTKARFAQAPKDNPDIYTICQNEPLWYNYVVFKYVWQKTKTGTMEYVQAACITTGLDRPADIQVTSGGDIVISEKGKNRVLVYNVKSVE